MEMPENAVIELYSPQFAGLAWAFQVNPLSCDSPDHYQDYIRLIAASDMPEGRGTTHILWDKERIFGFITLRASSYIQTIDGKTSGESALEISELAVEKCAERSGVGRLLVDFAFKTAASLNQSYLGIRYIVLCADPCAVGFYKKIGFRQVDEYGDIPREGWNENCIPMFIRLP